MPKEIGEHKRVLAILRKTEQELTIRNRISKIFLTVPDSDKYQEAMKVVLEAMNSECGAIIYIDEGDTRIVPVFNSENMEKSRLSEKEIGFPHATFAGKIFAKSLLENRVVISEGPFDLPEGHIPLRRILAVPIVHQSEVFGSIIVGNKPLEYDETDTNLLGSIADFTSPILIAQQKKNSLERKRKQGELELKKAHDRLEYQVEARTAELDKSKMLLQNVLDGIPDPLYLLDEKMLIKTLNKAACVYYHTEREYAIKCNSPCYQLLMGRSEPCDGCQVPVAIKERLSISYERTGMNDPGCLEQVSVYQINDGKKQFNGAILRIHDITDEKLMEQREIQSEKLSSLGLMVSSIVHEIANPVSSVTFNAPILKDYFDAMIPIIDDHARQVQDLELSQVPYSFFRKDAFKIVDNILHASHRIKTILNDLKKLYSARKDRRKTWVDFGEIIDGAMAVVGGEFNKKIKTFEVNLLRKKSLLHTDKQALEQVMINLLINAMHAADKETSLVTINEPTGYTWREHFIIEVNDNGCGMDEDTLGRIFNPFFTTWESGKGTGLGLYICQNLVHGLGGRIEVESEIGKGSVFRIILPDFEKRSLKRN